jgi:hypothetical protein
VGKLVEREKLLGVPGQDELLTEGIYFVVTYGLNSPVHVNQIGSTERWLRLCS